jgi:hypothetical protein
MTFPTDAATMTRRKSFGICIFSSSLAGFYRFGRTDAPNAQPTPAASFRKRFSNPDFFLPIVRTGEKGTIAGDGT